MAIDDDHVAVRRERIIFAACEVIDMMVSPKLPPALPLAAFLALSTLSDAEGQPSAGIPGVLDPLTGTFEPTVALQQKQPDAAAQLVSGIVKVYLAAKVVSNLPASARVYCRADITIRDTSGNNKFEIAGAFAALNGREMSCIVTIPYKARVDPTTAKLGTSCFIQAFDPSVADANQNVLRATTAPFSPIALPPNGKVTIRSATDMVF